MIYSTHKYKISVCSKCTKNFIFKKRKKDGYISWTAGFVIKPAAKQVIKSNQVYFST